MHAVLVTVASTALFHFAAINQVVFVFVIVVVCCLLLSASCCCCCLLLLLLFVVVVVLAHQMVNSVVASLHIHTLCHIA